MSGLLSGRYGKTEMSSGKTNLDWLGVGDYNDYLYRVYHSVIL